MSLVKLPPGLKLSGFQELAVFLIKADLKNRKFNAHLELVGFDPSYNSLDLASAILKLVELPGEGDDSYELYQRIVDEFLPSVDLEDDGAALDKIAVALYKRLINARPNGKQ